MARGSWRPLCAAYQRDMKLLWAALPLIALLLVATEPLLVLVGSFFLLHLWLLSGFLVITPPAQRTPRFKVFCIGLSSSLKQQLHNSLMAFRRCSP